MKYNFSVIKLYCNMENIDLKFLKKQYGENFAKLCRNLFPTILEKKGLLVKVITDHFAPSRSLYEDITSNPDLQESFKMFVYSFFDEKNKVIRSDEKISAEELMDRAGYILYPECKTEKEIQVFKKYYAEKETLCTFNGKRLESCRVWFAVKKDVDEIKRESFFAPRRQDKYGTSVISIQFSKGINSVLSIKNRYNHTVDNPDATFSNNLDNIIPGLTNAFCSEFDINLIGGAQDFEIPGYILATDQRYYRQNMEFENVSYCENNIIIDGNKVVKFDKARYIVFDNYILDLEKNIVEKEHGVVEEVPREIKRYGISKGKKDAFIESIGEIKKVIVKNLDNGEREIIITPLQGTDVKIGIDKHNAIVSYHNENVKEIGDKFLYLNRHLRDFYAPNLKKIGDGFLFFNKELKDFDIYNVNEIGNDCLYYNSKISYADFTNLIKVGDNFFCNNKELRYLNFPSLVEAGYSFFRSATNIKEIHTPKLQRNGQDFLYQYEYMLQFSNLEDRDFDRYY